jgi:hypothetical protein
LWGNAIDLGEKGKNFRALDYDSPISSKSSVFWRIIADNSNQAA